jgi:cytochrome c oxidase cbb3-type subunit 3
VSDFCKRSCCSFVLLALFAAGCDFPGRPNPADRPVPRDQIKSFDVLYAMRCAGCHGADGNSGPAPPLNDPLFLTIVSDAELLQVIRNGRSVSPTQRTPMPAFCLTAAARPGYTPAKAGTPLVESNGDPKQKGPLTDEQAEILAHGIKQRWQAAPPAKNSAPPYRVADKKGPANKEAGARVFERACAGCHGSHGEGAKGADVDGGAINDPAFLSLISDQELRRYAITGRPEFGMPPFDGTAGRSPDFRPLTSDEIDDLGALLADWRRGPQTKGN